MKVVHHKDLKAKRVEGSFKLEIKWLNTDGSKNFAVRHVEIEPEGYSPYHNHPWEHEMYVLEGQGLVVGEKETKTVCAGTAISIPPGEAHQVKNVTKKTLKLLCMIPK